MKKIYATLLLTLSIFTTCHAQIIQVDNMKDVFGYFDDADSKTLAIFDVDMVLVQPSEPAFQMANLNRYGAIGKSIRKNLTREKDQLFYCCVTVAFEPILVEDCTPQLLRSLQDKGVPAMVLTANLSGSLGSIPNMVTWRNDSLCALGMDFSRTAPVQGTITLDGLTSFRGFYPQYSNGIFCTNSRAVSKGDAFVAFIEKTRISPQKIIFIDDTKENLKNMEEALQKLDSKIEYYGLHYTGGEKYPAKLVSEEEFASAWKKMAEITLETN